MRIRAGFDDWAELGQSARVGRAVRSESNKTPRIAAPSRVQSDDQNAEFALHAAEQTFRTRERAHGEGPFAGSAETTCTRWPCHRATNMQLGRSAPEARSRRCSHPPPTDPRFGSRDASVM